MAAIELPSWLIPPSQAERERLSLAEEQVKQKSVQMLRKQIGLSQMQKQAEELKAGGLDEMTARKTALLNNAHLLFADNPEAVIRLQQNEEANTIRERAQEQTLEYRNRMATVAEQRQAEIAAHNVELENARRDKMISDDEYRTAQQQLKAKDQEVNLLKTQAEINHRKALEAAATDKAAIAREGVKVKRTKMIEEDTELRRLQSAYRTLDEQVKERETSGKHLWESAEGFRAKVETLKANRDDLQAQIDKRRKLLGDDSSGDPSAATGKKLFRYDPKTRSLIE